MTRKDRNVAVLGAGSWGTALAMHCASIGLSTHLWCRDPQMAEQMRSGRKNPRYLRDCTLPVDLQVGSDLDRALAEAQLVLLVVPSAAMRELASRVHQSPALHPQAKLLAASKGICRDGLATPGCQLLDLWPPVQVAALGGPSFALEVAQARPTAVVVASPELSCAQTVQSWLSGPTFRVYTSTDLLGVEMAGALKNVVALAAGICDGAQLGHNARAALLTRGLAEMQRLTQAAGARPETLWGLSGVGDLVLTCTGGLSRNRRVGFALGQGKVLGEVLDDLGMVAEGVHTTQSAMELAAQLGVDMPIVSTVSAILNENLPVHKAVQRLMDRAMRSENGVA